ncbi:large subunit of alpha-aminoadipate reductase [Xanthoria calcicola]
MSTPTIRLPDPTADLHWSDYRGAIHDIFAKNAERHPDRLCVVETQSSRTSRRDFTYSQINEASNQVAHHLLQHGIERGDVVMIYAHRGVDLVVAVFGVLKAGATFSVIDPAYPSDRQIIYLGVAKPKALIIIEKASQEAGELTPPVRSYVSDNLNLKTEIPALALQDNGTLTGGQRGGQDALSRQTHLANQLPGLTIGPDDIPTLSFTSGSEGRPKGVRGRHFSLTYYFPWMAERFGLSKKDKFTMLSGIAHDPIQRDMFTPLFLGAQLLVPSREDIQHERLAEWMKREGATVTHLTPAMGQILVGGASTEFPSLHHSFFVGDILIRRDVRRLQELAPNAAVVNMFGTTETQRAVSFFEVPSKNTDLSFLDKMTEVIPAGTGMFDVQLLVVDRENRNKQCSVGQIGEIYVRAGGLAEGYLGDELAELTKTKFVDNWFVEPQRWREQDKERLAQQSAHEPWRAYFKGPRDRLYRSGDLGRYMPSGDVECTGRADNQVKIRGFRIELGEIDKWVSEHPLCQENVTLLRRDKDEEPILVTYLVPNLKQWRMWLDERGLRDVSEDDESMSGLLKRFQALRSDLRDYLKTKLPTYAVPTVFLPLRRMALNPNGKIDKPALPFPNMAELAAATIREPLDDGDVSFSDTERTIAETWAKVISHTTAEVSYSPLLASSI